MEIIKGHKSFPENMAAPTLAIGNFDGVHRGHQAVLQVAQSAARQARSAAGVMVFEPHPRQFFNPDKALFRLTPIDLKTKLFEIFGLDFTVVLDFDAALAALDPRAFVDEILVAELGARHVVTGFDFHFGKDRKGTPELLREMGEEQGFEVTIVDEVAEDQLSFSSSEVRGLLRRGEVTAAAEILGYWWRHLGRVEKGAARGAELGFPTANVSPPQGFDLAHGIYAIRAVVPAGRFEGAAYVGNRPTYDDDGGTVIEAFLFDFDGDLYDQPIEIEFIDRVREDERFETPQALKAQMEKDCAAVRVVLEAFKRDDPMNRFPLGRGLSLPRAL